MRTFLKSIAVVFILFCTQSALAAYPDGYSQDFIDAMNWAMGSGSPNYTPNADGMVNNLKTLTHDTPGLIWKPGDPSRVLLSTFCDYAGYHQGYVDGSRTSYLWLAAAPDLQNFLINNNISGTDAALRTNQLLGMPANTTNDRVVELWASVNGLERPMKNPDVTNPNSSITYPYDPAEMELKYPGFMAWFEKQKSTYTSNPPYPWTQLGYTCDWGNPDSRVGLTEFRPAQSLGIAIPARFLRRLQHRIILLFRPQHGQFQHYRRLRHGLGRHVFSALQQRQRRGRRQRGHRVSRDFDQLRADTPSPTTARVLGPGKNLDNTYRTSVHEVPGRRHAYQYRHLQ